MARAVLFLMFAAADAHRMDPAEYAAYMEARKLHPNIGAKLDPLRAAEAARREGMDPAEYMHLHDPPEDMTVAEATGTAAEDELAAARDKIAKAPDDPQKSGALAAAGVPYEDSCRAEAGSACGQFDDDDERHFADRLVRGFEAVAADPECRQGHFLDASNGLHVPAAARIFRKCRVLVVKNAFPRALMEEYRAALAEHVVAVRNGSVSLRGTTTHGEKFWFKSLDGSFENGTRWLALLPPSLLAPEIVAAPWLTQLLRHPRILGDDATLNDAGVAFSEPGAAAQHWHHDDQYVFGGQSLAEHGIAGHDFGSFSVTVLSPLLDRLTKTHGPTEFCVGSSMLSGFEYGGYPSAAKVLRAFKNTSLLESLNDVMPSERLRRLKRKNATFAEYACFPPSLRVEEMGLGDVMLFDYQVLHRGGANRSPKLRTVLYLTYARRWYKDHNFASNMNYDDVAYAAGAGVKDLSPDARRRFDQIVSRSRLAVLEPGPNAGAPPPPPPHPAPRLEDFAVPLFALDGSFSDEAHDAYEATFVCPRYAWDARPHRESFGVEGRRARARDAEARAAALDEAFAASKDLN